VFKPSLFGQIFIADVRFIGCAKIWIGQEPIQKKNVSRSAASYLIGWLIPSLNLSDRLAIPSLNHSSALKECDTHAINSERAKRKRKYHRLRTKKTRIAKKKTS
jgi:hypothetical protein